MESTQIKTANPLKAIVTAGRSSALRPLTFTKNKHLIKLANKPMIFYALERVAQTGIRDVGIIVAEGDTEVQETVGDGSRWGLSLTYIPQVGGAKGIAHAIHVARDFLGSSSFMVHLGDNLMNENLAPFADYFVRNNLSCLLTLAHVQHPERFGVPEFDKNGRLVRVEERPVKPASPYAVAGVYFYSSAVHEAFSHLKESARGVYEISDLHTWMAQNGHTVNYVEVKRWWKDRGSAHDLLEGNRIVLETITPQEDGKVEPTVVLEGVVRVGANTRIGGRTVIRGPVTIGDGCLIKDSYIGPYTSIGDSVELHNADIENSIVYDGTSITTPRKITDSIIGENVVFSDAKRETPRAAKFVVGDNGSISI
jgi:glucose-1-phosphate thymidylyltransferase